jgi:hypothetical protein
MLLCDFDGRKTALQLVERAGPALLVATAALLVPQARMGQGELGPLGNGAQPDLEKRFAGILGAAGPAPAHAQPFGTRDVEILAAALMLFSVERAESDPEAAADPRVALRYEHGAAIGPPPAGDALRRGERVEDDRWTRPDPAHERQAGHLSFFLMSAFRASASLASA